MERKDQLLFHFRDGNFPDVSDDVLELISDFLVFSRDCDVQEWTPVLFDFLVSNLNSFRPNYESLGPDQYSKVCSLLQAIRFLRPAHLVEDQSRQLDECLYDAVSRLAGAAKRRAFINLLDHVQTTHWNQVARAIRVLEWMLGYIEAVASDIVNADTQLVFSVIFSMKVLSKAPPHLLRKRFEVFLKLAIACLEYQGEDENIELIAAKSLRLIAQFMDSADDLPLDLIELVKRLDGLVKADVKHFHTYQNYLIFLCGFVKKNQVELVQLTEKGLQQVLKNLPLFLHVPFCQNKRTLMLFKALAQWVLRNRNNPKPEKEAQMVFVVQNCLIHMSNLQGQNYTIMMLSEMIQSFLTVDFFKRHPGFQMDMFGQMMDNLDLTKAQLELVEVNGERLDVEVWMESQLQMMKVIRKDLCPDQEKTQIEHSTIFTNLFIRLTKYVAYIFDLVGHMSQPTVPYADYTAVLFNNLTVKQFQEKAKLFLSSLLENFSACLKALKDSVFHRVLTACMLDLLPSKPYHVYHQVLHSQYLCHGRPNRQVYQIAFFDTVSRHFDELFLPWPLQSLVDLTKYMLQDILVVDMYSRDSAQGTQDMVVNYAYKVMLSCMTSKNLKLLEVSFVFLWSIFRNENILRSRRDKVVELLKADPMTMRQILKDLLDEPELEAKASYLSTLVFMLIFAGVKDVKPETLESWMFLFVPALEKTTDLSRTLLTLYVGSRSFPIWMNQVREVIQSRILGAIGSALPRLGSKDVAFAKALLAKVPDLVVKHAKSISEWKMKRVKVNVDDCDVPINALLDAMKRQKTPTEQTINAFARVFLQFISQCRFKECMSQDVVFQCMEYFVTHKPEFIDEMYLNLDPPGRYIALLLRQKYGSSIEEIVVEMDDWVTFLEYVEVVCLKRNIMRASMDIYKYIVPRVPNSEMLSRIVGNLVVATQYEPKLVSDIFDGICARKFETPEENEVKQAILQNLEIACDAAQKLTRRIVVRAILTLSDPSRADVQMFPVTGLSRMEQCRRRIIADIAGYVEKNWACQRGDFIFAKPLNDAPNPVEQIERLSDALIKRVQGLPANIDFELGGNTSSQNNVLKFIVKAMARLFPCVSNIKQASVLWERLTMVMRKPPQKYWIPYFLKQFRKANRDSVMSIPYEMTSLLQSTAGSTQLPATPEDVMLINYAVESSRGRDHKDHLVRIELAIMASRHSFRNMGDICLINHEQKAVITEYIKFFAMLKRIEEPNVDTIHKLLEKLLELLLYVSSLSSIDLPMHLVTEAYPTSVMKWIVENCENAEVISFAFSLVVDPKCILFRQVMLSEFIAKTRQIVEFAERSHPEMTGSLLLRACSCAQEMYESLGVNDVSPLLLLRATKCLCAIYLRLSKKRITQRPSVLAAILKIFVPLKFVAKLNEDDTLFEYYRKDVVSLIMGISVLSCHPHFIARFTEMMKYLSVEKRNILYQEISSKNTESSLSTYLMSRILETERCKAFPDETLETAVPDTTKERPASTPFLTFLDEFMAASLATSPTGQADLSSSSIISTSSYVNALAIAKGLKKLDDIMLVSRFFNVTKAMMSFEAVTMEDYPCNVVLNRLLREQAFSTRQFLVCFALIGQRFPISQIDKEVLRYIIGFATKGQTPGNQMVNRQRFLYVLGPVFQKIHNESISYAALAVTEVLLSAAVEILEKNDGIKLIHSIPEVVEAYSLMTDVHLITGDLVRKLRSILVRPVSNENQRTNQTRTKFIFELIPSLADVLCDMAFCPSDALPWSFFNVSYHREMKMIYQKCLKSLARAGGSKITKIIIDNVYSQYHEKSKDVKLSAPGPSAFATIARWVAECKGDAVLSPMLEFLLDVCKPVSLEQAHFDFAHLTQPMNTLVMQTIRGLLGEEKFAGEEHSFRKCPELFAMYCPHSDNLAYDVWKLDWFTQSSTIHLMIFLKLAMPSSLGILVENFTDTEMMDAAGLILQNYATTLNRFFKIYIAWFPMSSLADAISMTPVFGSSYPFPALSLFGNMQQLDHMNLCDESLGLLKDAYPAMSDAATFQQLGNYKAAKGHYMAVMDENPNIYFQGLVRLRVCTINSTLPITRDLYRAMIRADGASASVVTLPFVQDISPNFEHQHQSDISHRFTSSFSISHIPYIMMTAMFDETYQMRKTLQTQTPEMFPLIANMARFTRSMWMKGLDSMMVMSSNIAWRVTMLREFLASGDQQIEKCALQLRECVVLNQSMFSRALVHSGNLKSALAIMQAVSATGRDYIRYSFRIRHNQLPRVWRFVKRMPVQCFHLLRIRAFQAVKDHMRAFQVQNPERNDIGAIWLRTVIDLIVHHPLLIEAEWVLNRLLEELNNCESKRQCLLMCIILKLLDQDPQLTKTLSAAAPKMKDNQRKVWLRWLPLVFARCPRLPIDFLITLLKVHPTYFALNMRHIQYAQNSPEVITFLKEFSEMLRQRQLDRFLVEFNNVFDFLDNKEDLQRLNLAVLVLRRTFGMLLSEGDQQIPAELASKFDSVDSMIEFCNRRPPVYTSSAKMLRFNSLNGFRFPFVGQQLVLRILLEADGSKEATLSMITMYGEIREFSLVCSHYYRLSLSEHLFSVALWRAVQSHPSSCTRTNFVYYPACYMLQQSVLFVDSKPFESLTSIAKPYSIVSLLAQAKQRVDETSRSPLSNKQLQTHDIPSDLVFKWFVNGTDGNKSNFLFMRQSLASHLGAVSFLHTIFGATPAYIPPLMLFSDRYRLAYPGFSDVAARMHICHLPLTKNLETLFPKWVLKGSFSTAWHAVAEGLAKNPEKTSLIFNTFLKPLATSTGRPELRTQITIYLHKLTKMTSQMSEDTEKTDDVFPFTVLNHLIDTSVNANLAQLSRAGWV